MRHRKRDLSRQSDFPVYTLATLLLYSCMYPYIESARSFFRWNRVARKERLRFSSFCPEVPAFRPNPIRNRRLSTFSGIRTEHVYRSGAVFFESRLLQIEKSRPIRGEPTGRISFIQEIFRTGRDRGGTDRPASPRKALTCYRCPVVRAVFLSISTNPPPDAILIRKVRLSVTSFTTVRS